MRDKRNDLFFVCSMLEKSARESNNKTSYIINTIPKEYIINLYNYADVFHCENPDKISYELIHDNNIQSGSYDKISICKYKVPSYWEIGEIIARLVWKIDKDNWYDNLVSLYNSFFEEALDRYNSDFYYQSPGYHLACIKKGEVLL